MYPAELPALPEQAKSLLDALVSSPDGMDATQLMAAADLSERGFRKSIRRLVTLRLVNMPADGMYALTERGRAAMSTRMQDDSPAEATMSAPAPDIPAAPAVPVAPVVGEPVAVPDSAPEEAASQPSVPAETPADTSAPVEPSLASAQRQLSVLVAEEMAVGLGTILMAGLNAPREPTMTQPQTVLLRVTAPNCEVDPVEQALDLPADAAAGPVRFKITALQPGKLRISLELVSAPGEPARVVDGIYFDVRVQPFPTSRTAEFRTLGAFVRLP